MNSIHPSPDSRPLRTHQPLGAALLALALLAPTGCQDLKNAMDSAAGKASAEAERVEANARDDVARNTDRALGTNTARKPDPAATGGGSTNASSSGSGSSGTNSSGTNSSNGAAAAGSTTSSGGAVAANASSSPSSNASSSGANPSAAGSGDSSYDDPSDDSEDVADAGSYGGGAAGGSAAPMVTNTKESVQVGTERWGWTDAEVGWYVRYRMQGGMEMSQEVVEATGDLLLMESKTIMPGMDMPATRTWQARRMVKYEGDAATTECKSDTNDLADESLSIGGKKVTCKVTESTTTCPGAAPTRAKSWMSDDVPGEMVKTEADGQVVMELVEFRM